MRFYGKRFEKDTVIATHIQDIEPVMALADNARKMSDNGWTTTRNMQCIGEIPDVVFFNHPEFYNDDKALRRWLNSDEGQPYRVGRLRHRHETAGVRVI